MSAKSARKTSATIKEPSPHVQPIYQTSVYDFPDLESLDDFYNGLVPAGYLYSRNGLPNSDELARQIAQFERAESGLVCSSGMAALLVSILAYVKAGEHILASSDLYVGTTVFLNEELSRFGIKTSLVDAEYPEEVERAFLLGKTKFVLVETISNPTMKVPDIREISKMAHENEAFLIVDNTMATPFVARPFEYGSDIVIHSGTKFLGGHHDITIGALCGRESQIRRASQFSTRASTIAGPFDCWLAMRSLSTWELRVKKSCGNAIMLARYLSERKDKVSKVYYPGLKGHGSHRIASKIFSPGTYGGMLSFDLKGGLSEASAFVKGLSRVRLTLSLGSVRTTISHPGKTSHRHITEEQKRNSGITDAMIRVSTGIEEYDTIEDDFEKALAKVH